MTLRGRLTAWYMAVLALALSLGAGVLYLLYSRARLAALDEELARTGALVARALPGELDESGSLEEAAADVLEHLDAPGRALAIFDAAGAFVYGRWEGLGHAAAAWDGGGTATETTAGGPMRVLRARHRHGDVTFLVGVAQPLAPMERELAALRRALLGSVLAALLLAAAGGWWMARATLQPLARMAGDAARITDRTPGRRLHAPHPRDELGTLARAFNDLLGRLESAMAQQRQFMADASHELRTPVSIARTAIDVAGGPGRPEAEYLDALGVVARQMRRLSRIVDDLFTLARADATGFPLQRAPLYLDELVADCVKEARVLAAEKPVALEWTGPADLEIDGDERLLRQMLMNLLHNAVRHTPPAGRTRVEITAGEGVVSVDVADSGPGVAEGDRERIFQRFVRLDPARSGEGAGLGLPIARAIAEAHGGTLVLARSNGAGSVFRVTIPARSS